MINFKKLIATTQLIAFTLPMIPTQSFALSPGGSGGGDVVVMPHQGDDSVRLADPWAKADAPVTGKDCANPFTLPPAVTNELGRVGYMLSVFGNLSETQDNEFISNKVLAKGLHYCLVDQLPPRRSCQNRMGYSNLPDGAKVVPAACTEGSYTWVVKDLVKEMSVREQAKLYVHEGMRRTNTPEETIAGVTDGLEIILEQYNQNIKDRTPELTKDQRDSLLEFRRNLALAGITYYDPRELTPEQLDGMNNDITVNRGGAIVYKSAKVHSSAYLGAGMVIGAEVGSGSKILNSQVDSGVVIGKNTSVVNSRLKIGSNSLRTYLRIGDNTQITNSTLYLGAQGVLTKDQEFQQKYNRGGASNIDERYMRSREDGKVGNRVSIQNSEVYYHYLAWEAVIEDGARVSNSKITNVKMEKGTVVANSSLLQDLDMTSLALSNMTRIEMSAGSVIQNVQLNAGKNGEHDFGGIKIGAKARLLNIGKTNLLKEAPVGLMLGSLALGVVTMGIGAVALGFAVKNTDNIFVAEGAKVDGRGRSACSRGQVVAFGTTANGEKVGSFGDLQGLCKVPN